jgi:hypothetical protein
MASNSKTKLRLYEKIEQGKLKEENDIEDIITRFPSINIKNGGGKKLVAEKQKKITKKIRKSYRHKK